MKINDIIKEFGIEQETVIDKPKQSLNPKLFNGMKLDRRFRKSMLKMIDFVISEIPLKKLDQYILEKNLVGSMTSFQWSDEADVDLHIVVDDVAMADDYQMDEMELIEILRKIAKQFVNKFYIAGYPVEFYIQTKEEPFYSDGVYDLEYDTWTKSPEIQEFDEDKVKTAKKLAMSYKKYIFSKIKKIEKDVKSYEKDNENDEIIESIKNHSTFLEDEFQHIKDKRNKAIREQGNASIENMRFKFLQRMKVLEKMKETIKQLQVVEFEP